MYQSLNLFRLGQEDVSDGLKGKERVDKIRILLAEDHPTMLEQLIDLLETEFEIAAAVEDGRSLVEAAETLQPDLIITDISMPILSGIEATRKVIKSRPQANIVFLTVHTDSDYIQEALELGVRGYVFKSHLASDLQVAIQEVLAGRTFVSSQPSRSQPYSSGSARSIPTTEGNASLRKEAKVERKLK
jgi:DNA-binding NarL/FixJ family response regulator